MLKPSNRRGVRVFQRSGELEQGEQKGAEAETADPFHRLVVPPRHAASAEQHAKDPEAQCQHTDGSDRNQHDQFARLSGVGLQEAVSATDDQQAVNRQSYPAHPTLPVG